jgi:hypothetical protein
MSGTTTPPGYPLPPAKVQAYADTNGIPDGWDAKSWADVSAGLLCLVDALEKLNKLGPLGGPSPSQAKALFGAMKKAAAWAESAASWAAP